jgi:hypothetical protein
MSEQPKTRLAILATAILGAVLFLALKFGIGIAIRLPGWLLGGN